MRIRMSPVTTDERLDSLCLYDVAAIFADLFRFLQIPDANGGPL
jgi:hypothetical protein